MSSQTLLTSHELPVQSYSQLTSENVVLLAEFFHLLVPNDSLCIQKLFSRLPHKSNTYEFYSLIQEKLLVLGS